MPELPEVETTRRGIAPVLEGQTIRELVVRDRRLRWPVPADMESRLRGARILRVWRRAKYLLLEMPHGSAMVHLGMSGSMRIINGAEVPELHDHFDLVITAKTTVRFNDPRRFGSLLWAGANPAAHPLLAELGPEPLEPSFNGSYLYASARGRRCTIKQHIMNSRIVAGVGNIYASESLFRAGIHPARAAGRIALPRMETLAGAIRDVLEDAIRVGGTTLRDYRGGDGKPGYFRQQLAVYERDGSRCQVCNGYIRHKLIGQRSSYYCSQCQR